MSHLTRYLQQQLDEHIAYQRQVLADADARIAQAELMALRLQSQGINALAAGRFDSPCHVLIWIAVATPHQRLTEALTRLDLIERERYVSPLDCEIYIQGIDVPIYLTAPMHPRNPTEQALADAIAKQHTT